MTLNSTPFTSLIGMYLDCACTGISCSTKSGVLIWEVLTMYKRVKKMLLHVHGKTHTCIPKNECLSAFVYSCVFHMNKHVSHKVCTCITREGCLSCGWLVLYTYPTTVQQKNLMEEKVDKSSLNQLCKLNVDETFQLANHLYTHNIVKKY